jgi:UDP-2,3-diacylglucosamine pyrophosphatase LpxH
VVAGDLVDFVGMSVPSPASGVVRTPIEEEEIALGLGSAEDHTLHKLRCVARRHATVFEALARFVEAGNTLVVVRGNHDVDFHWHSVQDEFVRQLALHGRIERGCVEFCPWFYYEEGRVYVEHGHQYDRYCSHEHPLLPVSPRDPRRSSRSLSDVLLRHVVRPTRGLLESGHERAGALDYLRFAFGLGVRGTLGLGGRFARAVTLLFGIWRGHFTEGAARLARHHERRMADLAQRLDMKLEALRALASLARPPVTRSFLDLAFTVMLDRVLLGTLAALGVVLAVLLARHAPEVPLALGGGVVGLACASVILSRARRHIEPSLELREGAARVARLFPAAFVVMGHTHLPEMTPAGSVPTTYVNLGAWADVDAGDGPPQISASRTHLVVSESSDGALVAELLVWDAETGPRGFVSPAPPAS